MNCNALRQHYEGYVRDELSARLAEEFEEHVQSCKVCGDWFEMQQLVGQSLREAAQDSLPPEHYFEGLYQRVAPRLTRVDRWARWRRLLAVPFESLAFSNALGVRMTRLAAICAIGVGIGWAVGGHDLMSRFLDGTGGTNAITAEGRGSSARADAMRPGDAVNEGREILQRVSQAVRDLAAQPDTGASETAAAVQIDPMLNDQARKVFRQIDLGKYNAVRDGNPQQLETWMNAERELLAMGQIQQADADTPRTQFHFVQQALILIASEDLYDQSAAEVLLGEVRRLDPETHWACLAQYLLATMHQTQGEQAEARALFHACLENFPPQYLNEAQLRYAQNHAQ